MRRPTDAQTSAFLFVLIVYEIGRRHGMGRVIREIERARDRELSRVGEQLRAAIGK